jgi:hypothetical protein
MLVLEICRSGLGTGQRIYWLSLGASGQEPLPPNSAPKGQGLRAEGLCRQASEA